MFVYASTDMAVDKEMLTAHVTREGRCRPAPFCPPGVTGYQPLAGLPFNPDAARSLLQEAGFNSENPSLL